MTIHSKTKFQDINWPIYHIRQHREIREDNKVLYIDTTFGQYIIDNKNLQGRSLAIRRLMLKGIENNKVYTLKTVLFNLSDLIKHNHSSKWYIDSSGNIFRYNKTKKFHPLKYYKVTDVTVSGISTLLTVEDIFKPIILPYIPKKVEQYAGLVVLMGDYIVYEFSETKKKDTRKMV